MYTLPPAFSFLPIKYLEKKIMDIRLDKKHNIGFLKKHFFFLINAVFVHHKQYTRQKFQFTFKSICFNSRKQLFLPLEQLKNQ